MGTAITFADPQRTIPYNEQFSFGLQRQLPKGLIADVSERLKLQFRAEAFNVTNTVWFPSANTMLTSPLFGQTVLASGGFASTSNDPRSVQMSVRLTF